MDSNLEETTPFITLLLISFNTNYGSHKNFPGALFSPNLVLAHPLKNEYNQENKRQEALEMWE